MDSQSPDEWANAIEGLSDAEMDLLQSAQEKAGTATPLTSDEWNAVNKAATNSKVYDQAKKDFLGGIRNQTLLRIGVDLWRNGLPKNAGEVANLVGKIPGYISASGMSKVIAGMSNPYYAIAAEIGLNQLSKMSNRIPNKQAISDAIETGRLAEMDTGKLLEFRNAVINQSNPSGQNVWSLEGANAWRSAEVSGFSNAIDYEVAKRGLAAMDADGVADTQQFKALLEQTGENPKQWMELTALYLDMDGDVSQMAYALSERRGSGVSRKDADAIAFMGT